MSKFHSMGYGVLFLVIVAALWAAMMGVPRPDVVSIDVEDGYCDLSAAAFDREVYAIGDFWQSYPGALYTPGDIASGAVSEPPRALTGSDYQGEGAVQFATHRLVVALPAGGQFGVDVRGCDFSMRLFIDGLEVDCVGVPGSTKESTVPRVDRRSYYFASTGRVEFVVQVANFHHREGGWPPGLTIGSARDIAQSARANLFQSTLIVGCLLTACLYHLGLFLLNRRRVAALLFSICCLLLMLRTNVLIPLFWPEYDWYLAIRLEYLTNYGTAICLPLFIATLDERLLNRRVLRVHCALQGLGALSVLLEPAAFSRLLVGFQVCVMLMGAYVLAAIAASLRKPCAGRVLGLIGTFTMCGCAPPDILNTNALLPIPGAPLTPVGMVVFVFAYSLVVALHYAQAERERELLSAMNRLKTEFLSNVSHELKTPLTVVSNYAQLARMHAEDDDTRDEYVRDKMLLVTSEAERMAVMVGQLLDIERIEQGRMAYHMKVTDIAALIRDAMNAFYPVLNKNGNRLLLDIPDGLPSAQCDGERIRQVLLNIVSNAIRFTYDGTITVSAKQAGGLVAISVADTGEGIAPGALETLFDRYYTAPPESGNRTTGTGLGLHISRNIVEAHGGAISIQSEVGRGTAVTFTLPAVKEDA